MRDILIGAVQTHIIRHSGRWDTLLSDPVPQCLWSDVRPKVDLYTVISISDGQRLLLKIDLPGRDCLLLPVSARRRILSILGSAGN